MTSRKFLAGPLAVVVAALCSVAAVAQVRPTLSEQDWFDELPVVLSASRLAQPLNAAPAAVTMIDSDMIRHSGARHVVDLLRLVPGFQVAYVPNGAPAAVYHGLAQDYPRHMQVLVDGRSQYSPFFIGGVNWNLVPVGIEDIERIEVIRGSNSAAYGSNAFLGVVNIITRHAAETRGAVAELRRGSGGIEDRRLRLGAGGENLNLRLTAETQDDRGLDNFRDDMRRRLVDVRADWRLGLRDELQLQLGEISTVQQQGSNKVDDPWRSQAQRQQFVAIGWRRALGDAEDLAVRYYRSEERAGDAFTFAVGPFTVPLDYGFSSVRNNVEVVHTFRPLANTRLAWGGELRTDAVTGALYYGRADAVSLTIGRVFGNLEWRPGHDWVANAGATWEYDSNAKTTFAPRFALNWHVAPGQTLRAGIARAYRTPSLFETRSDFAVRASDGTALLRRYLSTGTVEPERVTSREIGWLAEFPAINLTGDLRIFEERVADRILGIPTMLDAAHREILAVDAPFGDADNPANVQQVKISGLEHQLRWQPRSATRVILNQSFIRMSASMNVPGEGLNSTYDPAMAATQAASSAPTHTATLMLIQRLPGGVALSATYHSVGAMKWGNYTYTPSYRRLDWRLAYPFRLGQERGEVAFTVQSDGTPHPERAAADMISRRGFASLRLEF